MSEDNAPDVEFDDVPTVDPVSQWQQEKGPPETREDVIRSELAKFRLMEATRPPEWFGWKSWAEELADFVEELLPPVPFEEKEEHYLDEEDRGDPD